MRVDSLSLYEEKVEILKQRSKTRGKSAEVSGLQEIAGRQKNSSDSASATMSVVTDAVEISNQAKQVKGNVSYVSALKELPDERQDRINALKEQIAAGTYNVSATDIANKIVALAEADLF